jgi:hypothetical protein
MHCEDNFNSSVGIYKVDGMVFDLCACVCVGAWNDWIDRSISRKSTIGLQPQEIIITVVLLLLFVR